MRRPPKPPRQTRPDRLGVGLLGCLLLASAALSTELAQEHMALLGVICGSGHAPHCGWCYAAVGLALAGITALLLSARRPPGLRYAPVRGPGGGRTVR